MVVIRYPRVKSIVNKGVSDFIEDNNGSGDAQ